jgi:hypothetical protein
VRVPCARERQASRYPLPQAWAGWARDWYLSLELPPGLDGSRRRIRRGGFPSQASAELALGRLRMPSPGDTASPPLTVGQWLERWLVDRAVPRLSTLRGYAAHVRLYLALYLGQILLADLSPAMCRRCSPRSAASMRR